MGGLEAPHMRTAAECRAKVEEIEKRALECDEPQRSDWQVMADHWRMLEASASNAALVRRRVN